MKWDIEILKFSVSGIKDTFMKRSVKRLLPSLNDVEINKRGKNDETKVLPRKKGMRKRKMERFFYEEFKSSHLAQLHVKKHLGHDISS